MHEEKKESSFEKIESLIMRNDLVTAEKLMKKYEASLSDRQKEQLRRKIRKQQKERQGCARKAQKQTRPHLSWKKIWWIQNALFNLWIALGVILYPYVKTNSFTLIPSWGGPNVIMESLFLVQIFLIVLFCGGGFLEAHQSRKDYKAAMNRTKNRKDDLFHTFSEGERDYAGQEKKWLIAFLTVVLFFILYFIYVVKYFRG